jgi:hypothetical protein
MDHKRYVTLLHCSWIYFTYFILSLYTSVADCCRADLVHVNNIWTLKQNLKHDTTRFHDNNDWLVLFKEIIAVHSLNRMKSYKRCEQTAELLIVKAGDTYSYHCSLKGLRERERHLRTNADMNTAIYFTNIDSMPPIPRSLVSIFFDS